MSMLNVKLLVTMREKEIEISTVDLAKSSVCRTSSKDIN